MRSLALDAQRLVFEGVRDKEEEKSRASHKEMISNCRGYKGAGEEEEEEVEEEVEEVVEVVEVEEVV